MGTNRWVIPLLRKQQYFSSYLPKYAIQRFYHEIPFFDLYHQVMGQPLSKSSLPNLKRKHPNIDKVNHEQLQCTLQILKKFGITPVEACQNPHLFSMNPISMENYGDILKECGFVKIAPQHIIKYYTLVKIRTIRHLKRLGLLQEDLMLEELLQNCFDDWPESQRISKQFPDISSSICMVRVYVLEQYLQWRLSVTSDEFKKYCKNYLPLKHRPMSDIKEALNIAQNDIKFDVLTIKRNGFIISSDPVNTRLILQNVNSLAGLDIRGAIRVEPAILKNNYNSLLQIKKILEEYQISLEAQRRSMRVFCMCPSTVQERLEHLTSLKEYQVLSTNPRVLSMVVHKTKVMSRLEKIQEANKQCFSLNHLISSSKVFNSYINNFGNKVCGRDIAILISTSLEIEKIKDNKYIGHPDITETKLLNIILNQLKKHKYWLHTALNVVNENILFLKQFFNDNIILNNCQILLYPEGEIRQYILFLIKMRDKRQIANEFSKFQVDVSYNHLNYESLTDDQILSIVLYEIEKKHHFSGDGVWNKQIKADTEDSHANQSVHQKCIM